MAHFGGNYPWVWAVFLWVKSLVLGLWGWVLGHFTLVNEVNPIYSVVYF